MLRGSDDPLASARTCVLLAGERTTPARVAAMATLLRELYASPERALAGELAACDRLYWLEAADGQLLSFLHVSTRSIEVAGEVLPAYYLGLGATRRDLQGRGAMLRGAYAAARRDIASLPPGAIVWVTTSTPLGWVLGEKLGLTRLAPDDEGRHDARAAAIAAVLRRRLGAADAPADHPFALRGVEADLAYVAEEQARLREVRGALGPTLLDRLAIDTERGDALLVLFRP